MNTLATICMNQRTRYNFRLDRVQKETREALWDKILKTLKRKIITKLFLRSY